MAATPVDAGEAHELLTPDDAKHSFCGIMFDLEVLKEIPVDTLTITSVSVRGSLGPMAVYSTPGSYWGKHQQADQWTQHYPETEHDPSDDVLKELEFDEPLVLKPGDTVGMYVHSTQRGGAQVHYGEFDENNPELHNATRTDQFISIKPGQAHLSNKRFHRRGPWGTGWRKRRSFVGKMAYSVTYLLWSPTTNHKFPATFRRLVCLMLWVAKQIDIPVDLAKCVLAMCPYDIASHWPSPPQLPEPPQATPAEEQATPAEEQAIHCRKRSAAEAEPSRAERDAKRPKHSRCPLQISGSAGGAAWQGSGDVCVGSDGH
jgi:hypothetical protein